MSRDTTSELEERLSGKSKGLDEPYPLIWHMLDSAAAVAVLWSTFLSPGQRAAITRGLGLGSDEDEAGRVVAFWAALHDIGKISVQFQSQAECAWQQLPASLRGDRGESNGHRAGHAGAGMESVADALAWLGDVRADGVSASMPVGRLAQIVGGHHGRYARLDSDRLGNRHFLEVFGGQAWSEERRRHAGEAHVLLGAPAMPPRCSVPCAVMITGLVILADWLVSQEHYLRRRQGAQLTGGGGLTPREHLAYARRHVPHLVEEAGLLAAPRDPRLTFAEALDLPSPNPLQQSVMEELPRAASSGPGILVVTAATGDGKTETGWEAERLLSAVSGANGFVHLLPTTATSDHLYTRTTPYVRRQTPGSRASVTLTHSMAWLNAAYTGDDEAAAPQECPVLTQGGGSEAPRRWLHGAKRALLAQFAVGTVDQALMAILPVRHNALRMLALSGKTVIVDEAHAYDPYMQVLLGRLVNWLAAYGCSVILLSATLPRSVGDRLVKEYLNGAGRSLREMKKNKTSFPVPYPGWLFASADGGAVTAISEPQRRAQAEERNCELEVEQRKVRHLAPVIPREAAEPPKPSVRFRVLEEALEPVLSDAGGVALVVCTTVDDAQATHDRLRRRMTERDLDPAEITLLHARLPAEIREERSGRLTAHLGRTGERPHRQIVVATQVIEQSLDLDADLVVSDLAPIAQLLQRAGRCWRHEKWWREKGRPGGRARPRWAVGPRLVVLDPLLDGGKVPAHWGEVYPEALLAETSALLAPGNVTFQVPEDVPGLVEDVHGDRDGRYDWDSPHNSGAWLDHKGKTLAMEQAGRMATVPRPLYVRALEDLHQYDLPDDERVISTRLGADSVRVLCVYEQSSGALTLDADNRLPLPESAPGARLRIGDVRSVMRRTIPVAADWFDAEIRDQTTPRGWSDYAALSDLVVLRLPVRDGVVGEVTAKGRSLTLDSELGLVRR